MRRALALTAGFHRRRLSQQSVIPSETDAAEKDMRMARSKGRLAQLNQAHLEKDVANKDKSFAQSKDHFGMTTPELSNSNDGEGGDANDKEQSKRWITNQIGDVPESALPSAHDASIDDLNAMYEDELFQATLIEDWMQDDTPSAPVSDRKRSETSCVGCLNDPYGGKCIVCELEQRENSVSKPKRHDASELKR